jgi:hypothetical protein
MSQLSVKNANDIKRSVEKVARAGILAMIFVLKYSPKRSQQVDCTAQGKSEARSEHALDLFSAIMWSAVKDGSFNQFPDTDDVRRAQTLLANLA